MKKFLKKKEGFTLVELIIVIAILAILAAIAIPAYSGYIKKANDAADLTQLDAIKTAAAFVYTEEAIAADPTAEVKIESLEVVTTSGTVSGVKVNDATDSLDTDKLEEMLGGSMPTLKGSYKGGATWDGTAWTPVE